MKQKLWHAAHTILFFLCWTFSFTYTSYSQSSDDLEVFLAFRHRSAINTVVIAYYKNDTFYLPYNELFQLLQIDRNANLNTLTLFGKFLEPQTPYEIQLQAGKAFFGNTEIPISPDEILIKDIDFFLVPEVYKRVFNMDFVVDFNNLTLSLESEATMPVVAKIVRSNRRDQIQRRSPAFNLNYPLQFGRERKILNGGFFDYNLSGNFSNRNSDVYTYNTAVGLEVLGGDVQGNINGIYSEESSNFETQRLRWRYVVQDDPRLTALSIGQATTSGAIPSAFSGIQISNFPIEPRRLFDEFAINGFAEPRSEVELYVNNTLVDFAEADPLGNYRFLTPLTYGNSKYDIRIYGPTGEVRENSSRIQIPFNFIPPGEVNYNLSVGRLDNPVIGTDSRGIVAQGDVSAGLNDWLTARVGAEYFDEFQNGSPTILTGLSSRVFSQYLLSAELATNAFFRANTNVVYPNAASFSIDFTEFLTKDALYNPTAADREISVNTFYPIRVAGIDMNVRAFGSRRIREFNNLNRYRFDVNSRFDRFNVRLGFSDTQLGNDLFKPSNLSRINSSVTYTFSRANNLPKIVRGAFIRTELSLLPKINELEQAEVLVSRNIFRNGRFQAAATRNFFGNFNSFSFNLVVDFNKVRSNSTFRSIGGNTNLTHTFRGSVGFDSNHNQFLLSGREQVGRSAVAFKLFTDNNDNGIFDEGDELIPDNAIRMDRTGTISESKNGIQYYSQLQSYFKYNLEINRGAIKNPLLVPNLDKFGMISDPNFYKVIEIPFYLSGVISGEVLRTYENKARGGVSGLKLIITKESGDFVKEVRTFSDGSFYDFELAPGNYVLKIDTTQLEILNLVSEPLKIDFEIKPLSEGDFLDGLNFLLKPKIQSSANE